jgi:rubrerythrin
MQQQLRTLPVDEAMSQLMGLAIFGEKVAARTYSLMAKIKPDFDELLRKFSHMEGQHGTWFMDGSRSNKIEPDKAFADRELGYLIDQVDEYYKQKDFNALAILQGFIVESLAISTYEPFLEVAHKYPGSEQAFKQALADERYHVDWITRYLRLEFFESENNFLQLAERVNTQGVDCIGGSMMNIVDCLNSVGLSGADCSGTMVAEYTGLLESVGIDSESATKNVMGIFMPLIRKYKQGERTK